MSASKAGSVPMAPSSAIKTASRANEGTVCIRPAKPSTAARKRGCGKLHTASGMASRAAKATEASTRARCWPVRRARSGPKSLAQKPRRSLSGFGAVLAPFCGARLPGAWPARKPRAITSNATPCSSARAFSAIMALSSIRPSNFCNAAQAAGKRVGRSSR